MAYTVINPIGAKFTSTTTAAEFELGEIGRGENGTTWIYTQLSTAVTAAGVGYAEAINSAQVVTHMTLALACAGDPGVFAQCVVAPGEYFWGLENGNGVSVAVASACAADVPLYATSTPGVLDDAANGSIIKGVTLRTTVTGDGTRVGVGRVNGRVGAAS